VAVSCRNRVKELRNLTAPPATLIISSNSIVELIIRNTSFKTIVLSHRSVSPENLFIAILKTQPAYEQVNPQLDKRLVLRHPFPEAIYLKPGEQTNIMFSLRSDFFYDTEKFDLNDQLVLLWIFQVDTNNLSTRVGGIVPLTNVSFWRK
jgi:hypothetical protein